MQDARNGRPVISHSPIRWSPKMVGGSSFLSESPIIPEENGGQNIFRAYGQSQKKRCDRQIKAEPESEIQAASIASLC